MFRIKGKSVSSRVAANRTGVRARRLPSIVLSSGAVIKVHPNRHVFISTEDLKANYAQLLGVANSITISLAVPPYTEIPLSEVMSQAEPEPVVEAEPEPVVEAEPEPVVEAEPEPVVEAEPEPVVEPEPEPVVKKTRRKRRTKAQIAADKAAKEKS